VNATDPVAGEAPPRRPVVTRRQAAEIDLPLARNLRSFLIALLFATLVLLVAAALGLLIATSFYGYRGLG
jgi:hypothetical protein